MLTQEESSGAVRLTEAAIGKLPCPPEGQQLIFDAEVPGLAVRLTAGGITAFVLCYRIRGRQRRFTVGRWPELSLKSARERAIELRAAIRDGADPLEERFTERNAATVKELGDRYLTDHAIPNNRPRTLRNVRYMLEADILPRLGRFPVAAITRTDIQRLHGLLRATPYKANRVKEVCSTMFGLSVQWGMRPDNPAAAIADFPEYSRERWLQGDELKRFSDALNKHLNRSAANAIRLLLLTGSRKSEVLRATWGEIDLKRGVWTKPSAHTKQKKVEHVPLSKPAIRLLRDMQRKSKTEFLFPGEVEGAPIEDVRKPWAAICKAAKLTDFRVNDLRHTFASHLVSEGVALHTVGRLIGHTQTRTTQRYAHLADSALRDATNQFGRTLNKAVRQKR